MAGQQVREPALLLVRRTEPGDRAAAQTNGRFEGDAEGLVHPADLLDGDARAGKVPGPAVLLRAAQAEQPEVAHQLDRLQRSLVRSVPAFDVGRQVPGREVGDYLPEVLVVGSQCKPGGHHRLLSSSSSTRQSIT